MNPQKQTNTPEAALWEKTKPGDGGHGEKPGDAAQRTPSSLARTHFLPSTQTVMVSPLSRTEGPRSRPLPPDGSGWEASVQKLAGLEKEAQRLRRLLALEATSTTQGTMTAADGCAEKPPGGPETPPASTASREVGCQTDATEVSRVCTQYLIMMTHEKRQQRKMFYYRPSARAALKRRSNGNPCSPSSESEL